MVSSHTTSSEPASLGAATVEGTDADRTWQRRGSPSRGGRDCNDHQASHPGPGRLRLRITSLPPIAGSGFTRTTSSSSTSTTHRGADVAIVRVLALAMIIAAASPIASASPSLAIPVDRLGRSAHWRGKRHRSGDGGGQGQAEEGVSSSSFAESVTVVTSQAMTVSPSTTASPTNTDTTTTVDDGDDGVFSIDSVSTDDGSGVDPTGPPPPDCPTDPATPDGTPVSPPVPPEGPPKGPAGPSCPSSPLPPPTPPTSPPLPPPPPTPPVTPPGRPADPQNTSTIATSDTTPTSTETSTSTTTSESSSSTSSSSSSTTVFTTSTADSTSSTSSEASTSTDTSTVETSTSPVTSPTTSPTVTPTSPTDIPTSPTTSVDPSTTTTPTTSPTLSPTTSLITSPTTSPTVSTTASPQNTATTPESSDTPATPSSPSTHYTPSTNPFTTSTTYTYSSVSRTYTISPSSISTSKPAFSSLPGIPTNKPSYPSSITTEDDDGGYHSETHTVIWPSHPYSSPHSMPVHTSDLSSTFIPTASNAQSTSAPGMHWSSYTTTEILTTTLPDGHTSVITRIEPTGTLVPDSANPPNAFAHNPGAVAGVTIGGLAFLFALTAAIFVLNRRRVNARKAAIIAAHASFGPSGPSNLDMSEFGGAAGLATSRRNGTLRGRTLLGELETAPAATGLAPPVLGGRILTHAEMESIASEDGHSNNNNNRLSAAGARSGSSAGHGVLGGPGSLSSIGHASEEPLVGGFGHSDESSRSHGHGSGSGSGSGGATSASHYAYTPSSIPWWQATSPAGSSTSPEEPEKAGFRASLRARLRTSTGGKIMITPPSTESHVPMIAGASIKTRKSIRMPTGEWDEDMPEPVPLSPRPPSSPGSSSHGHGHDPYTPPPARRTSVQRPPATPLFSRVSAAAQAERLRGGALPTLSSQIEMPPMREWPLPNPGLTLPPPVDPSPAASAYTAEGLLDPRLQGSGPFAPYARPGGGMASSTSFADGVDYSRPIGAFVTHRGYSSRTFGSLDTFGSTGDATLGHDMRTPTHEPDEAEVFVGRAE